MSYLRSVEDHPSTEPTEPVAPTPSHESESGQPTFEGQQVELARIKLSAANNLDTESNWHIDDLVRIFVEGRVTRVDHVVDESTGKLKRVHTVRVVEAIPLPWDDDTLITP